MTTNSEEPLAPAVRGDRLTVKVRQSWDRNATPRNLALLARVMAGQPWEQIGAEFNLKPARIVQLSSQFGIVRFRRVDQRRAHVRNHPDFWPNVDVRGPDECWEWTGRTQYEYGAYKHHRAHRFALEEKLGRSLRREEHALHRCDNPPCVNPSHLYVGDATQNTRDMMARGRNRHTV